MRARVFEPLGMTDTGFWLPESQAHLLPSYYMTDFATGKLELQALSPPQDWTRPPVFPSGSAGLVSTVDDYLAFARLLLGGGVYGDRRLLTERSVAMLTTNRLTPDQIATAGFREVGHVESQHFGIELHPQVITDLAAQSRDNDAIPDAKQALHYRADDHEQADDHQRAERRSGEPAMSGGSDPEKTVGSCAIDLQMVLGIANFLG